MKKILATVSTPKSQITQTWEVMEGTDLILVFRQLENGDTFGIPLDPDNIDRVASSSKVAADGEYFEKLNISDGVVVRRLKPN